MEKAIDSALVRRFSCFQSLNAEQIAAFATHLEEVRLPPGKILFRQGDPGDSFYLLLSGQIVIKLGAPAQDDRTLATLGPGAILGEMGPLVHTPRTATAIAAPKANFGESQLCLSRRLATRRRLGHSTFCSPPLRCSDAG